MIDHIKLSIFYQSIIDRLLHHQDFITCTPLNRNYHSFSHKNISTKLRFDFRKAIEKGKIVGYHHVEVNIFPHYHFNKYRHNGNDFNPTQCITAIKEILSLIGIERSEYIELNITNLEFGINLRPSINVKTLINNLLYSTRTKFIIPDAKLIYSKLSDSSSFKQIKVYAKGIHCHEQLKVSEVDINTFRFEIKSKQAKYINKLRIKNVNDLLNVKIYDLLMQEIIKEWQNILILTPHLNLEGLKPTEIKFIDRVNNIQYWNELISYEKNRNKYNNYKKKYNRILKNVNGFHYQIESLIRCKFLFFQSKTDFI
ncbi:hypothetical protein [Chryseobacterium sp.]|uniref:hypothetical protein n=1 Tax=Chryseobacterium sp. TaxID=1871047 RepID=UPI0024E264FE|nr:hypothetical protein [Chryseobacterium sp.]